MVNIYYNRGHILIFASLAFTIIILLLISPIFSIGSTGYFVLPTTTFNYKDYWVENKENITSMFNPYIEKFHQIYCIDHNGLRELLQQNQKIKAVADNLTSNLTTELEIVYTLHQFVYNNIKYEEIDDLLTPEQILSKGKGDCSEKSILLAALLETKNINAYVADGYEHRYVFTKIDGTWLPIDPSTSDFYFVYKNWNNEYIKDYTSNIQSFIFNSTVTLFNKNWCI